MELTKADLKNAKEFKIEKMDGTDLVRIYWTSSPMRKWYSLYKRIPNEEEDNEFEPPPKKWKPFLECPHDDTHVCWDCDEDNE